MECRQQKPKFKVLLLFGTLLFCLLLFACGSGGDSDSGSGSISFDLAIGDSAQQGIISKTPGEDICDDYLIESIDITVMDASGTDVASASWPCDAHQGTLLNVPAESNLTVAIEGKVNDNPDWHKQLPGISVAAGDDTKLGTVELDYRGDDEAEPAILSHFPDSNATEIPLNSSIIVTFSEDIVEASVVPAFSLSGATTVEGDLTYDPSTFSATFIPSAALEENAPYTIHIAATVKDRSGRRMAVPFSSSFTTGLEDDIIPPTAPTLLEATAVSASQIDLSWEAASDNIGVAKYLILRNGSEIKSVSTIWTTDVNLSPDTRYCYTVVAVDAADNPSDPSNEICADTPPDVTPPPVPELESPRNDETLDNSCEDQANPLEWDFFWEGVADATQYRIQVVRAGASDSFIFFDTVEFSSSYHYSSDEPILNTSGSVWSWKVRAGNDAGEWSQWSPERYFSVEPVNTDCARIGLVAYYPFNGNANDASRYENHGTVNGATLATDRFDNQDSAYWFNGNDSDIRVSNNALINMSNQITVAAWIYPEAQKTQHIVRKGSSPRSVPYGLLLSGTGDIIFEATTNGQLTQVKHSGYSLNNWSFIAGTYDGAVMTLYVNGVSVSSVPITGELNIDSSSLLIGTRLNLPADTFSGRLDDIFIFNRALTDSEIATLSEAL